MTITQTELFTEARPVGRATARKMRQHATKIQNGTWTIQNQDTGDHRTFKIATQKPGAGFAPSKRIVSIMTGCDNETSYTNFAFVSNNGERIFVWKNKRGGSSWSRYQHFADMLHVLMADRTSESGHDYSHYTITGSGRCYRCNHKLTNPISLETGIGPKCAGRM